MDQVNLNISLAPVMHPLIIHYYHSIMFICIDNVVNNWPKHIVSYYNISVENSVVHVLNLIFRGEIFLHVSYYHDEDRGNINFKLQSISLTKLTSPVFMLFFNSVVFLLL